MRLRITISTPGGPRVLVQDGDVDELIDAAEEAMRCAPEVPFSIVCCVEPDTHLEPRQRVIRAGDIRSVDVSRY